MLKIEFPKLTEQETYFAIIQYRCDQWLHLNRDRAEQMLRMHGDNACAKPDGPVMIAASFKKQFNALSVIIHLFQDIEPGHEEPINSLYFDIGLFEDIATQR